MTDIYNEALRINLFLDSEKTSWFTKINSVFLIQADLIRSIL